VQKLCTHVSGIGTKCDSLKKLEHDGRSSAILQKPFSGRISHGHYRKFGTSLGSRYANQEQKVVIFMKKENFQLQLDFPSKDFGGRYQFFKKTITMNRKIRHGKSSKIKDDLNMQRLEDSN
jgi:hypothetical protein